MLLHTPSSATREQLHMAQELGYTGIFFRWGISVHPVPEFYKHYFYLYTERSPDAREDFLATADRLCAHEALQKHEALKAAGEVAIGLTERLPRRGPDTPFDPDHPRWADAEWAPPLDEDPDPEVPGGFR